MPSRAAGRLLRSVLMVGAASAALSLAGPDALVPFKDAAASAATIGVAFVVDFGSGAPVVGCVQVPPSDNGYAALAAFAAQEHLAAPAYNQAGLLCSIGGIPASGCGQATSEGYDYWSYWHGATGAWVYSEVGAFATVQPGDVEGWRYEDPGHANPTDPPPAAAPDDAAICPAAVSPSSPPANPPATSPPTATTPGAASSGGTASSGSTPAPAPAGSTVTTPPVTAPAEHAATTNTGRPGAVTPRSAAGTSTTTTAVSGSGAAGHTRALGAPRAPTGGADSGGSLAPLVIGGALVAALALAAGWQWRRRPRSP
jgi:hypothetical protein